MQLRANDHDLITVTVNDQTNAVRRLPDPLAGNRAAQWIRWIHDGSRGGPVWQFIVFLTGFFPVVFAVTGLLMWRRGRQARERGALKKLERSNWSLLNREAIVEDGSRRRGMSMMGMSAWFHLKSLGKACHSTCSITSVVWLCFNTAAYGQSTAVNAELPRDLSPWGMYLAADWVVKSVMIGLLFASIVTWTIWLAKAIELVLARRRLRRALQSLSSFRTLGDAAHELGKATSPADNFVRAAMLELQMTGEGMSRDGVRSRIASRLDRIEVARGRAITRGTGVLATIGATAPFVGLFGTVWGIMNSFIGISKAQTTNLAVVAPGIAEALLATAFGLAAAIPAVVIYNVFSRQIAGYRGLLGDASAEVQRLVSRDLDRKAATAAPSSYRQGTLSAAE